MMQIDGKTYHTLEEASEQTGYTKGTIQNYIYTGTIDGDRMEDGQWFVTDSGMTALKRRKKPPAENTPRLVTMDYTPADPEKRPVDVLPSRRDINVRTADDLVVYNELKEAAGLIGIAVSDLSMQAIRHYVANVTGPKLAELKSIDEKRKKILKEIL